MEEILSIQICLCKDGPVVPGYPCKEESCTWHNPKCSALTDEAIDRLKDVTGQVASGDPTACPYWPKTCECNGEPVDGRPGDEAVVEFREHDQECPQKCQAPDGEDCGPHSCWCQM